MKSSCNFFTDWAQEGAATRDKWGCVRGPQPAFFYARFGQNNERLIEGEGGTGRHTLTPSLQATIIIENAHHAHSNKTKHFPSLGQTCYLELACGFTYTLHISPPRDGGTRAIPEVLKGPPMSFLHLFSAHLLLKLKKG
jgi:hypothetical protein